jgi:hypothetical protein
MNRRLLIAAGIVLVVLLIVAKHQSTADIADDLIKHLPFNEDDDSANSSASNNLLVLDDKFEKLLGDFKNETSLLPVNVNTAPNMNMSSSSNRSNVTNTSTPELSQTSSVDLFTSLNQTLANLTLNETRNESTYVNASAKSRTSIDLAKSNKSEERIEAFVNKEIANFAQYDGKLIAVGNHTELVSPRIASPRTNAAGYAQASSNNLTIVLALVGSCVVVIVVAIILSVLFVMRRRFNTWRLDGSKSEATMTHVAHDGGENGATGSALANTSHNSHETSSTAENKCIIEKEDFEHMMSVENKQAVLSGHTNEGAELSNVAKENAQEIKQQPTKSSSSSSSSSSGLPLIETNDESKKLMSSSSDKLAVSSTLLIANVLTDLSESVASRLSTTPAVKSPNKEPNVPDF